MVIRNAGGGEETINLGLMTFVGHTALLRSWKSWSWPLSCSGGQTREMIWSWRQPCIVGINFMQYVNRSFSAKMPPCASTKCSFILRESSFSCSRYCQHLFWFLWGRATPTGAILRKKTRRKLWSICLLQTSIPDQFLKIFLFRWYFCHVHGIPRSEFGTLF